MALHERIFEPPAKLGRAHPRRLAGRNGLAAVRRALIGPDRRHAVHGQVSEGALDLQAPPVRRERHVIQADVCAVIAVLLQIVEAFTGRLREWKLDQPSSNEGLRVRIVACRKE